MRRPGAVGLVVVLTLLAPVAAWAQASITGTVRDSSGVLFRLLVSSGSILGLTHW